MPDIQTVLRELGPMLGQHSSAGTAARLVCAEVLEELLVRFEYLANGAQVIEVLNAFNKSRPIEMAKLPLGTAGTANEAVAAFRSKLARGYRTRLTLESLPNDMTQKVAVTIDQIVADLRQSVAKSYQESFESARSAHASELSEKTKEWETRNNALRSEIDSLQIQEAESAQLISSLQAQVEEAKTRLRESTSSLDSLQSRFQLVSGRETAGRVRVEALEKRKAELDAEVLRLQTDAAENRRDYLLLIDKLHQLELTRQSDLAALHSGAKRIKELEAALKKEESHAASQMARLAPVEARIAELEGMLASALKIASAKQARKKASPARKSVRNE